jgi:phenol 2-monooxygenase (NADPH)
MYGSPNGLGCSGVGVDGGFRHRHVNQVVGLIERNRPAELPDEIDVLIVGTGPAGMLASAQVSQFPNITTRIIERRPGRLAIGQADGIQCRTVETFQAFGFTERITAEAYRITETAFWKPDPADPSRIIRTARTPDDPAEISEFPRRLTRPRVLDYYAE